MDKNNFFVKDEIKEADVLGHKFKFKAVNADDELNWIEEYREEKVVKDKEGNEKVIFKENLAKLAKCKLRNIVEVPFSREELKGISCLDKEFKDYTNEDKDKLFGQLSPDIMSRLIKIVDSTRTNQKKS